VPIAREGGRLRAPATSIRWGSAGRLFGVFAAESPIFCVTYGGSGTSGDGGNGGAGGAGAVGGLTQGYGVADTIAVGVSPQPVAFDPVNPVAYVGNSISRTVSVIDADPAR
jgi:DNA-binding beta-propeller fold protein YncE